MNKVLVIFWYDGNNERIFAINGDGIPQLKRSTVAPDVLDAAVRVLQGAFPRVEEYTINLVTWAEPGSRFIFDDGQLHDVTI